MARYGSALWGTVAGLPKDLEKNIQNYDQRQRYNDSGQRAYDLRQLAEVQKAAQPGAQSINGKLPSSPTVTPQGVAAAEKPVPPPTPQKQQDITPAPAPIVASRNTTPLLSTEEINSWITSPKRANPVKPVTGFGAVPSGPYYGDVPLNQTGARKYKPPSAEADAAAREYSLQQQLGLLAATTRNANLAERAVQTKTIQDQLDQIQRQREVGLNRAQVLDVAKISADARTADAKARNAAEVWKETMRDNAALRKEQGLRQQKTMDYLKTELPNAGLPSQLMGAARVSISQDAQRHGLSPDVLLGFWQEAMSEPFQTAQGEEDDTATLLDQGKAPPQALGLVKRRYQKKRDEFLQMMMKEAQNEEDNASNEG